MNVRKTAVAGQFYPRNPQELQRVVLQYLSTSQLGATPEKVAAIVAPHAGYVYSGTTAGFAFSRVCSKEPKRVILVGCSHRYTIENASVFDSGVFETPLGNFPIDEPFAKNVASLLGSDTVQPHLNEHCLEVQLPFLWGSLGILPIVPILFGWPAREWHIDMGKKLAEMADDGDLLIASTDLSHYLTEQKAHQIDKRTLDMILSKNIKGLIDGLVRETCSMCGGAAVVTAMAYSQARGANAWFIRDYRTSGATSGDYNQVVGYAAISMERE